MVDKMFKGMRKLLFITILFALLPINVTGEKEYYEKILLNQPDYMKGQPVDLHIEFKNPCYAVNEKKHSIRVFYKGKEIESQIYDLRFDGKFLKACNIIFLYQGKGEYIIKYGEKVREINYKDHVSIDENYYYIEPIPGYYAKLNFYEIRDENELVFAICQEGNVLGIEMANKVVKLKDGAKEFNLNNIDQMFSFAFFASDGKEIGTDEKLIGKKILVDGNLMVRVAIESASKDEKMKTKAIYSYYHCENGRRIFAFVQHESAENMNKIGTYFYMICLKSRSKTIKELNIGEILPYIHLKGEEGIEEYRMESNPESKEMKWIITPSDNIKLGENGWVSIDDKKKAYALIVPKLRVSAGVKEEINVPGLEVDGGGVSLGGEVKKGIVYEGLVEFFAGKYEWLEEEAEAFYNFLQYRNFSGGEFEIKEEKKCNLTVVLHWRFSLPFARHFSALLGINIPHVEVEISNEKGTVARSAINFRKANFELPKGNYTVKVYWVGRNEKIIGVKYVELFENKKIHIFCTFQGYLSIEAKKGCKVKIFKDGLLFEKYMENDSILVELPAFKNYRVQIFYKGFLMEDRNITLLYHKQIKVNFSLYDFIVIVRDKFGLPIGINLSAFLTSSKMLEKEYIEGKQKESKIIFSNLPKGMYDLYINYKSFKIRKEISVPGKINITFPAEYEVKVKLYDRRGFPIQGKIVFERMNRKFEENILPPAKYKMIAYSRGKIAEREIFIASNSTYYIVTNKNSIYPVFLPLLILSIFAIFKKKEILIALLLAISTSFSWWKAESNAITNLYILPPKMIEMHSTYGNIVSLPPLFEKLMYVVSIFILISIAFILMQKLFKLSFIPLTISLILYIYGMRKFASITLGKLWGTGMVEGVYTKWGLGIGFYLAIASLILIILKVVYDEFRRRS